MNNERPVSKMAPETVWWLDLTDPDPYFTTDLCYCAKWCQNWPFLRFSTSRLCEIKIHSFIHLFV